MKSHDRPFKRYLSLIVLVFGLTGSVGAQDTVAVPIVDGLAAELSLGDMTAGSEVIVQGTCTDLRSVWVGRNLVTLATVAVSEALKGSTGETITVVLPGGSDSNRKFPIAMTYPGA